jgi:hypothetical protein
MTAKTLHVTGGASGMSEQAATLDKEVIRKGEFDAALEPLLASHHAPVTIQDTQSIDLALPSGSQQLSAEVRRKTTGLSADQGEIGVDANGLFAKLGRTAGVAASGADMADVLDALAGKAAASHTHAIADVTGLSDALTGKAAASHGHAIADVAGLQDALDSKSSTTHSHSAATSSAAGFMSATDKQRLDALGDNAAWRPSVATLNDLPLNVDPVGVCRMVRALGRVYRCVATVGFLSDQWKPASQKYSQNIGTGSATAITVLHGLQSEDVIVQVRKSTAPKDVVVPDGIRIVDENNVLLSFTTAPASGSLRVTIT